LELAKQENTELLERVRELEQRCDDAERRARQMEASSVLAVEREQATTEEHIMFKLAAEAKLAVAAAEAERQAQQIRGNRPPPLCLTGAQSCNRS
jgi:hypothetical protein